MAKLLVLIIAAITLLQVTPGYCAQQLNAEGIPLMQENPPAEAESQFRQAVQANPSNIEAVTNLGVAIFKQARFAESIPFFEQAVASRPLEAPLHNDLAQACVRVGRTVFPANAGNRDDNPAHADKDSAAPILPRMVR
jgi:Flp pilus assembly protein TadD